jgi:hypothetical protein
MSVQTGVRGTLLANTENVRVRDVTKGIALLEPDEAQLTTFMMNIPKGSERAINAQVEWIEDEFNPRFDTLAADLSAVAVVMTVTNFAYFRKGDLVKVANAEVVRVTATPSANPVSIARAQGSTAAAAVLSGGQLFIMSSAHEENSSLPDLLSVQKAVKFNNLQILRDPFGVSQTAKDSQFYGEQDDLRWQRKKFAMQHKRSIENAIIHGERGLQTVSSQYLYLTGGILEFIDTNITDAGGTLTELEWEDHLRKSFRYGSKDKLSIMSPKAITVINTFGRDKLQTKSEDSLYGVTITRYQNAGRKVRLVEHDQLTNDGIDDFSGFAGYVITVDLKDLKLRYMGSAMTRYLENQEPKGTDGQIDEYRSQVALEVHQERNHSLLRNVTA